QEYPREVFHRVACLPAPLDVARRGGTTARVGPGARPGAHWNTLAICRWRGTAFPGCFVSSRHGTGHLFSPRTPGLCTTRGFVDRRCAAFTDPVRQTCAALDALAGCNDRVWVCPLPRGA